MTWIAACALLAVLRAPTFRPWVWNLDEGFTTAIAQRVLDGAVPYRDAVDHRAPLTYLVYAATYAVAGGVDLVALSVAHWLSLTVVLAGLAWLAGALWGARARLWALAGGVFMGALWLPLIDGYAFHTEHVLIVFTTLGACGVLKSLQQGTMVRAAGPLGLAYGLACLAKQPALLDAGAAIGVLAWAALQRPGGGPRAAAACVVRFALGGAVVWLLTLSVFAAAGAARDFWFYVFTYNTDYYLAVLPGFERLGRAPGFVARGAGLLTAPGVALVLAGVWSAARAVRQRDQAYSHAFLLLWLGSGWVSACLSGRGFPHYLLQAGPPLALLFGRGLDRLRARISSRAPAWVACLAASLIGATPFALRLREARTELAAQGARHRVFETIAAEIEARTPAGSSIFVWGMHAELYAYTGRPMATRFPYVSFVVGLVPFENGEDTAGHARWQVPGALDQLLHDLERARPAAIVDWSLPGARGRSSEYFPLARYPRLEAWIEARYQLTSAWGREGQPFCGLYVRRDLVAGRR